MQRLYFYSPQSSCELSLNKPNANVLTFARTLKANYIIIVYATLSTTIHKN